MSLVSQAVFRHFEFELREEVFGKYGTIVLMKKPTHPITAFQTATKIGGAFITALGLIMTLSVLFQFVVYQQFGQSIEMYYGPDPVEVYDIDSEALQDAGASAEALQALEEWEDEYREWQQYGAAFDPSLFSLFSSMSTAVPILLVGISLLYWSRMNARGPRESS